MYVGAHLPLDVVGGAALGLSIDAVIALVLQQGHRSWRQDRLTRR